MKAYVNRLPPELLQIIHCARDTAAHLHCKAYLVGGFVRDLILGMENFDMDISVENGGIIFAEALAERLKAHLLTHKRFGTATLTLKHHLKIDVATARKESYPHPGSLPVVDAGKLEDDMRRRDFTINALAIDISEAHFGEFIDICGGRKDIAQKKVRILHNESFIDDPTRILRAVRFETRFGFSIEPRTLKLLKEAGLRGMLAELEPQRLRDELELMLKEKQPLLHLVRLAKLSGLGFIHPSLRMTKGLVKFLKDIGLAAQWFAKEHHHRRRLDVWLMYWMGIMEPLGVEEARQVSRRFALRKADVKRIMDYKMHNECIARELAKDGLKASAVFRLLEALDYEGLLLMRAKYAEPSVGARIEQFLRILDNPGVSLSGHDLKLLGIPPGPCYQKIFRRILNGRIDGKIRTKEEEAAFVKHLIDTGFYCER
jgi:tRNA nucleotidyltransferase (CCA-adding enzyme)